MAVLPLLVWRGMIGIAYKYEKLNKQQTAVI